MSRRDPDPIERLRSTNPTTAEEIRETISAEDHRAQRERAIEAGERARVVADNPGTSRYGERARRHRLTLGLAAVLAAATVAAGIVVLGGSSVGPGDERAFAAAAVEVAESNPRLLIGEPAWTVRTADEFEADHGWMEFENGGHKLSLHWDRLPGYYPDPSSAEPYLPEPDQWYRIPIGCAGPNRPVDCGTFERRSELPLLGTTATLTEHHAIYPGREFTRFDASLGWAGDDDVTVRIDSAQLSREEFIEVVQSLHTTDVETWLAALPAHVVAPLERPEVVDEMLADVPIPASVDVSELKGEPSAAGRYQLGAAVTGAVACGWLDQWANAVETGNEQAAGQAVNAMATSPEWAILVEMDETGGWSETIWEYAEEMRRDDREALLGFGGAEYLTDGRVYENGPSYAMGLGCDSERHILREGPTEPPPAFPQPIPVDGPSRSSLSGRGG